MKWQTYELYLRNLMAQQLEIPILGQLHFACPQGSSTSLYEEYARTELDIPAELLHMGASGPREAFNACSANRNDVVLVFPGAYDINAELAWSKAATHLVGLGGPNTHGDYSEPNVAIYTDLATAGSTITVTGNNCQFVNATVVNVGAAATALTAFTANAYGCYYKNMSFQGNMAADQLSAVAAASLYVAGGAMFNQFMNCQIGNDQWGKRSGANSGQVRFTGTVQPNGIIFKDTRIVSWSQTASCAAVALPANGAVGRGLTFDNCLFYNLYDPAWAYMENVFYDNDMAGQTITLKDCAAFGYQEWQANGAGVDRRIWSNMGVATLGGGLPIEPTGTIA